MELFYDGSRLYLVVESVLVIGDWENVYIVIGSHDNIQDIESSTSAECSKPRNRAGQ